MENKESTESQIKCAVCGCLNTKHSPVRLVPSPFELAFTGKVKKVRLCANCRVEGQADAVFALGLL